MNQSIWLLRRRPLPSHAKKHTATKKITNTLSGSCLLQMKSGEFSNKMAVSSLIWVGHITKVRHVRFTNTNYSSNFATRRIHLAQELFHYNPTRLPTPAEWVTVRRVRLKDSVNVVWWLSKSTNPKSDNRKVLLAYSAAMEDLLKRQSYNSGKRPSEHDINATSFLTNNGGAIAPNVLALANSESNSGYIRRCKENGLQLHPARFPVAFAEFFVRFLTDDGDDVLDPFGGSGATAEAAERMGRNWTTIEIEEEYIRGAKMRFTEDAQPLLLREEPVSYGKKKKKLKTA